MEVALPRPNAHRAAGSVTGLDMTDEQLDVARAHTDEFAAAIGHSKSNMRFVKGYIEDLSSAGIEDETVDMIISNCVVNLSPDKPAVLREAYRVLAPGGELHFSDVYCDRRLPKHVQEHEVRSRPPHQSRCRACILHSHASKHRRSSCRI